MSRIHATVAITNPALLQDRNRRVAFQEIEMSTIRAASIIKIPKMRPVIQLPNGRNPKVNPETKPEVTPNEVKGHTNEK